VPGPSTSENGKPETALFDGVVVGVGADDVVLVRLDGEEESASATSQLMEVAPPFPDPDEDDPLLVRAKRADVSQSRVAINLADHPLEVSRVWRLDPPPLASVLADAKHPHAAKLDVLVRPGERLGLFHPECLGFAAAHVWQEFDEKPFVYLTGLPRFGAPLAPGARIAELEPADALRPAFNFKVVWM
jgi:hypothetical protein